MRKRERFLIRILSSLNFCVPATWTTFWSWKMSLHADFLKCCVDNGGSYSFPGELVKASSRNATTLWEWSQVCFFWFFFSSKFDTWFKVCQLFQTSHLQYPVYTADYFYRLHRAQLNGDLDSWHLNQDIYYVFQPSVWFIQKSWHVIDSWHYFYDVEMYSFTCLCIEKIVNSDNKLYLLIH